MIGAMSDITKRKEAEDALRASEAELRALFAAMNDVIFVLDREGRYLRVAPTSPSLLYLPPAELVGKTVREALPPEQAELIAGGVRRALDLRRPVNVEYGLEIAGEKMWFLGTASPLTEESVIFVARDITERRRAAEALQKSEEQLLQAQKMESIGTLAGGVAHDFNNLLTAILGNTQLALRAVGPGHPLRRRLLEIEKAGSRAGALTRQLLAFSRRQRLERRNINLNDTVADITRMLQRIIGADVEVSVTPAPDLLPVFADPAQIEQVVMNLAVNARDAMPHGGRLLIETRNVVLDEDFRRQYPYVEPGSYVELRVSDTGTGMDEGTRARAFEPFFTTKGVGQGTGLGLAMTYGIVKQHGGYIHVRSEVGRGAAFHIFLPASKEEAGAESRPAALPLVGGTETVLVAEDEEALRRLARDILEGLGYKVLLASDGEDALEVYEANRERIDLLLMDVVMPRLGGAEAAERIRAAGGRAPVIFVTGYSAETVQSRFVEENKAINDMAAAVIQKPYGVESLGRAVRHALDSAANK
jgi:two-component system, cell cycle sensor histidine kinase and response regulator CckA